MRNASPGLLLIGFLSITSTSELSAQSPATATPPPRLLAAPSPAPAPQIYYLTEPVWVTIGDKAYGFGTGTQFEFVQEKGNRVVVKNGDYEFEVDRAGVTSDYAVAKLAHDTEIAQQEEAQQQAMGSDGKRNRRKRQEVAELEAKLKAARKAEKERQTATGAEEERAAMERKAAAEVALASRVAEFKKEM